MPSQVDTMVYTGKKPWHSDPQKFFEKEMTYAEIMSPEGLGGNTIEKRPFEIDGQVIPGYFGLYWKEESQRLGRPVVVGMCKSDYKVISPATLVGGFFDPIVDRKEAIYHSAGILRRGMQFWALAKLLDKKYYIRLPGGDDVIPFIDLFGWHDGLHAAAAILTMIRVECANTQELALRLALLNDKLPIVTFRHNANAEDNIAMGHEIMGLASIRVQNLRNIYERMAKTPLVGGQLQKFLKFLLPSKQESKKGFPTESVQKERDQIVELFDDPINFTPESRGTLWNLYNATTAWVDHVRDEATRDGYKIERLASAMSGSGAEKRQKAMDWFMAEMQGQELAPTQED